LMRAQPREALGLARSSLRPAPWQARLAPARDSHAHRAQQKSLPRLPSDLSLAVRTFQLVSWAPGDSAHHSSGRWCKCLQGYLKTRAANVSFCSNTPAARCARSLTDFALRLQTPFKGCCCWLTVEPSCTQACRHWRSPPSLPPSGKHSAGRRA